MVNEIFADRESIAKSEWKYESENLMLAYKKKTQNRKKKEKKKSKTEDQTINIHQEDLNVSLVFLKKENDKE